MEIGKIANALSMKGIEEPIAKTTRITGAERLPMDANQPCPNPDTNCCEGAPPCMPEFKKSTEPKNRKARRKSQKK